MRSSHSLTVWAARRTSRNPPWQPGVRPLVPVPSFVPNFDETVGLADNVLVAVIPPGFRGCWESALPERCRLSHAPGRPESRSLSALPSPGRQLLVLDESTGPWDVRLVRYRRVVPIHEGGRSRSILLSTMNRTGEGRLIGGILHGAGQVIVCQPAERPDWRHRPRAIHRNCELPSTRLWAVFHLHGDQSQQSRAQGPGGVHPVPAGRGSGLVPPEAHQLLPVICQTSR